jgi:hypothetical protein
VPSAARLEVAPSLLLGPAARVAPGGQRTGLL